MAEEIIHEALLEMHFHKAVVNHFTSVYGANFFRLLKPSPQQESWVGFDQGWVHTTETTGNLFDRLQAAIATSATSVDNFFLGYFLQFKKVAYVSRKPRYMPTDFTVPHLRTELSLVPNKVSGLSQHETLLRLSNIANASVSYACVMFFNLGEIYRPADLSQVRCVPLATAPTGWATNERHFILFRKWDDPTPAWFSEPHAGMAFSFQDWASPRSEYGPKELSPAQVIELIESAAQVILKSGEQGERATQQNFFEAMDSRRRSAFVRRARILPPSFTLIEFTRSEDTTQEVDTDLTEPPPEEKRSQHPGRGFPG